VPPDEGFERGRVARLRSNDEPILDRTTLFIGMHGD
jgi:hypothetical protein